MKTLKKRNAFHISRVMPFMLHPYPQIWRSGLPEIPQYILIVFMLVLVLIGRFKDSYVQMYDVK